MMHVTQAVLLPWRTSACGSRSCMVGSMLPRPLLALVWPARAVTAVTGRDAVPRGAVCRLCSSSGTCSNRRDAVHALRTR